MAAANISNTQAVIEQLKDMALDPALEDCCRRDLEQQIKSERIRQALQRDDRVEARQRLAAATLRTSADAAGAAVQQEQLPDARAPSRQQQQQQQEQLHEGDHELQRLRQQRLRQLQAESAAKQEQRREGFGVLNTVPESSVLVSTGDVVLMRCCLMQAWRAVRGLFAQAQGLREGKLPYRVLTCDAGLLPCADAVLPRPSWAWPGGVAPGCAGT